MNIKILYDNEAKLGFKSGWGFSALINDFTLFDTGENEEGLLANIDAFGVDLSKIKRLVLSHDDWDHVGGLGVISSCGVLDVYLPAGASFTLKKKVMILNEKATIHEVSDSIEISEGLFVTACLGTSKKEISLAAKSDEGLVLLTGCAHPGLDLIMEEARKIDELYAVMGGFHGFDKLELLSGLPVIAPCHCTKKKMEIAEMYPEQVRLISAGTIINIGDD